MKNALYALATSLLILACPVAVAEPAEAPAAPPCHWFDYSLSPPGYHLDVDCLITTVLDLLPAA